MAKTTYSIGDQLSVIDRNGKVYRIKIQSISAYPVAKQLATLEILAQSYISPYDTISKDMLFYICSNVEGDASFDNLILWDNILNHTKTVYLTKTSIYKMSVLPIPVSTGSTTRTITEIMTDVKTLISKNILDCQFKFEDITDEEGDELVKMKKSLELARATINDLSELETVRPLVTKLGSLDIDKMTTDIQSSLASIQSQLSAMAGE